MKLRHDPTATWRCRFIKDKRSQGLDEGFVRRYERELGRMSDFMKRRNNLFPCEIEVQHLTEFRAEWNNTYKSSVTRSKVQERLRAFLRYCFNARMIDRIPKLSPIKVTEPPTMPLSDAEYEKLFAANMQFTRRHSKPRGSVTARDLIISLNASYVTSRNDSGQCPQNDGTPSCATGCSPLPNRLPCL